MSVEIGRLEIMGIMRRRKKLFLWSSSLIFFISAVTAFVIPSVYKSEAMIVVENQEIPDEYVKSTITSFVGERLHIMSKKILSYQKLLEIIREHQLYPDIDSDSEMISQMRQDIELETIDVSVRDRQSSKMGKATIAFTLSYVHNQPELAKIVADTLANLYVEEEQKSRIEQASTTTKFLEKEVEDLRQVVKSNEEKISRFKSANIKELPGSMNVLSQTIFRLEQGIENIDTRIRTNQEKIIYLKSQIANIDPLIPIMTDEGKVANNPNNRLKYLRMQLIGKQANLSDKHPDIIRMKSEIAELESQVGQKDTREEQVYRLTLVEKQIAGLKAKYGNKHPDIIRLSKEAELLKRQINADQSAQSFDENHSDNPGYMNIKAQIIATEAETEALREERTNQANKLADYQRRLERAPFIDEEYNSLTLDYENAKKKFNEVANKLHSARISQEMDTSDIGGGVRFRIDYPANLPGKPFKPNRLLIILIGIVLGGGIGVTLVALTEGLDASVKNTDELETIAGIPVLATVSFFDSPQQKHRRRMKHLVVVATVIAILLCGSFMVNWFVMPIGDLWDKFEDRLIEIGVPLNKETKEL